MARCGVAFHSCGGKVEKEGTGGPACHWLVKKMVTDAQPTPLTSVWVKDLVTLPWGVSVWGFWGVCKLFLVGSPQGCRAVNAF